MLKKYRLIIDCPCYNAKRYIYIYTIIYLYIIFITNFKLLLKLEQGRKKKFEKQTKFYIKC